MRDRAVDVDVPREPDRLAVVERLDLGDLLGALLDRVREGVHQALATGGGQRCPRAVAERRARSRDGARDVLDRRASATSAISRPLAGSSVVNVRPSSASRRSAPIRRRCGFAMNSRAGAPSAPGSVSAGIVAMRGAYLAKAYAGPMPEPSKAVLITGCSSGIGRASALRLSRAGWTVYATARRPQTLAELADAGCHTLALDVTDEQSMIAAVGEIESADGAVGVLINNAGYSQSGAIETVPIDAARRQFETNVFGLVRLTQLVLGKMRAQRWGKIVNLGSMGGRLSFPGGGHYHASKYALEAISDALRFELRGFGIDVVLLEPGLITTEFGEAATTSMSESQAPRTTRTRSSTRPSERSRRAPTTGRCATSAAGRTASRR